MTRIEASWIERFATRLIELRPQLRPLDAVRNAADAFDETSLLEPEDAAEAFAAVDRRHAAPAPRQRH